MYIISFSVERSDEKLSSRGTWQRSQWLSNFMTRLLSGTPRDRLK